MEPAQGFFSFNVTGLLGDLGNIALDTCADAFDAFERAVAAETSIPEHDRALMQQGIDRLFPQVLESLDQSVTNFERLCAVTCLQVPAELFLQQPTTSTSTPYSQAEEEEVDAQLQELREQLMQAKQQHRQLRQELHNVNRDLQAAGSSEEVMQVTHLLNSSKGVVMDDITGIAPLVDSLRHLLAAAAPLRKTAAAAAAAGAGGPGAAGVPGSPGAAQRQVHQVMAHVNAGAQQLQSLRQALTA